jgi:hypothetical protein
VFLEIMILIEMCNHQAKVEQNGLHKPDAIGIFVWG